MKRAAGFGLVEFLVVVSVVGVLAAIAIPAYTKHLAKAKLASALADISNLKIAFQMAMDDGMEISSLSSIGGSSPTSSCATITAIGTATTGEGSIVCIISDGLETIRGATVTWTRSEMGQWSCATTAPASLAPSSCPGI